MVDSRKSSAWEDAFRERLGLYERLKDEVIFALSDATASRGIKTHLVHGRVKELKSLADKARKKGYVDPLYEADDIVGVRVVVLFLADLPRVDEIISQSFEVLNAENKVTEGDPASFGYMSVHYLATLKDHHSGPRYDDLKDIPFEIQTRTIVMDAWANVSHYLDYKGESSVPEELRRDFFALSGLFYVADQHFELFSRRASESQERAEEELKKDSLGVIPINLDTVAAFLANRYPDREHAERADISEFVEEITRAGYEDLGHLSEMLEVAYSQFLGYEEENPPDSDEDEEDLDPGRYQDIGAARFSLAIVDPKFEKVKYDGSGLEKRIAKWRR